MSNKSKSRKKKSLQKLGKTVADFILDLVELRVKYQKFSNGAPTYNSNSNQLIHTDVWKTKLKH